MHVNLRKHARDIASALRGDRFSIPPGGGIGLFNDGLRLHGEFIENSKGIWTPHRNLVVDEGVISLFNVYFGSIAKLAGFYLAPFGGSSSPAAGWTHANFTANATENVSTTEGFSETTRQAITFTNAVSLDQIDNYSSKAAFTIVTASTVSFTGLGCLSVATRGGTTGILYSATKFATAVVLNNAAVWSVGYRAVGTPS